MYQHPVVARKGSHKGATPSFKYSLAICQTWAVAVGAVIESKLEHLTEDTHERDAA